MKRVFLIVLDSCGIGEEPDASEYGDHDCNTLKRISEDPMFNDENMKKLGLANIDGQGYLGSVKDPLASVARLQEVSHGKDTTVGHWEIAGVESEKPFPTYPNGFPQSIIEKFEKETGRGVLCNRPFSGTDVIRQYGEEHMKTGKLIVYTSADSVFQIAAHEDIVPLQELYEDCRKARKILSGKDAVARVIARPFTGTCSSDFVRTTNRHDFSLEPYGKTVLDAIKESGMTVYSVGKIFDIFAGRGITDHVITHGNEEGMQKTSDALGVDFNGLCFTNLVDFDMLYGHRQDIPGYAKAFAVFDRWLPSFISGMKEDDIVMITADHGCDPGDSHTDHTREYVPLLIYGKKIRPVNYGTVKNFSCIAATVAKYLGIDYKCNGKPLI